VSFRTGHADRFARENPISHPDQYQKRRRIKMSMLSLDDACLAAIVGGADPEIWGHSIAQVCKRLRRAVFLVLGHHPWWGNRPPPPSVIEEIFRTDNADLMARLASRGLRWRKCFSGIRALACGAPRCLGLILSSPLIFPLKKSAPDHAIQTFDAAHVGALADFVACEPRRGEAGQGRAAVARFLGRWLQCWGRCLLLFGPASVTLREVANDEPAAPNSRPDEYSIRAAQIVRCLARDAPDPGFAQLAGALSLTWDEGLTSGFKWLTELCGKFHSSRCLRVLQAQDKFGGRLGFDIISEALCPVVFRPGFLRETLSFFWPPSEQGAVVNRAIARMLPVIRNEVGRNAALLAVARELEASEFGRETAGCLWPERVLFFSRDEVDLCFGRPSAPVVKSFPLSGAAPEYLIAIVDRVARAGSWRPEFCPALLKQGSRRCALFAFAAGCPCKVTSVHRAIKAKDLGLLELALRRAILAEKKGAALAPGPPKGSLALPKDSPAPPIDSLAPPKEKLRELLRGALNKILKSDQPELLEVALRCGALRKLEEAKKLAASKRARMCLALLVEKTPLCLPKPPPAEGTAGDPQPGPEDATGAEVERLLEASLETLRSGGAEGAQKPVEKVPEPPPPAYVAVNQPTEAEVDQLAPGGYLDWGGIVHVRASRVGGVQLYYVCPFCSARARAGAREEGAPVPVIEHMHGSGGNKANRVEHRATHCFPSQRSHPGWSGFNAVAIHVTPSTQRC